MARKSAHKTPVDHTFDDYVKAMTNYEDAWRENDKLFSKVDRANPKPEYQQAYAKSLRRLDQTQKAMFSTYDRWHRMAKTKITVPEDEILTIIRDAVAVNYEALNLQGLKGLARHRAVKELADRVLGALKAAGAVVREDAIGDPPRCEPCAEEWAA